VNGTLASTSGATGSQSWTAWFTQGGNVSVVKTGGQTYNCSKQSGTSFCGTQIPFGFDYTIFLNRELLSNSSLVSYFQQAPKTISLGLTSFALTNYTLSSRVTNNGQTWTSGYFEVGHVVGSNAQFLLAVNLYSGTQPYLSFEVISATKA